MINPWMQVKCVKTLIFACHTYNLQGLYFRAYTDFFPIQYIKHIPLNFVIEASQGNHWIRWRIRYAANM